MSFLFIALLSCINVNMSGKLKHEHDVNVKVRMVDDTGDFDTGDPLGELPWK
tara:strand:+ start:255 stop:410 length:156 start_codon:yes stop_codon:yes gene_type:complete